MADTSNPSPAIETPQLCSDYTLSAGVFDEMCASPGQVRGHWAYLAGALQDLGAGELQRRREEALRQVRDNDVTFNIYGDPLGMGRPWELDLIPLLIESEEWRDIEAGLMQRAELLNLVLTDLYGNRDLVRKGVLPPELVYAHPGFLRPCAGAPLPQPRSLLFYAADLARTADGSICVLSDRAQAPSGSGYALENRIVISRVLPSLFRDSHVHRLANFFRTMRHTLHRLAPQAGEDVNIVLLTPGPANEAYFEHAYLANYLGYTLVEGSDLTVRDGKVWLMTLNGLRRVDVILRRMDDSYCDPVELREDSFLGVPGLLQVVRNGQVAVANPLGSGVLENPALQAFMPALAQHLLGEDLRLPSVPAWWCGEPRSLQHVLENFHRMVIKPVHPSLGFRSVFVAEQDGAERERLQDMIRARPHLYTAQEPVSLSTVPALAGSGLEPRRTVLRSFLVADETDYMVMPGGLTRVSSTTDQLVVSNQAGGASKDTWVLATEPEKHVSLLAEGRQVRPAFALQGGEVPGRVADNLFWLGRYAERAEFGGRLLRLALQYIASGEGEGSAVLPILLATVTRQTGTFPGFTGDEAAALLQAPETELLSIISNSSRSGGLAQTLSALLQSARSVRDRLSSDTWRVTNDIEDELRSLQRLEPHQLIDALDEIDNLITALTALTGLTQENMTRGSGWLFLDAGRRIERAIQTGKLLRSLLVPVTGESEQAVLLESVLSIVDSLMSYRRLYRTGMQTQSLLELVVGDARNPRSIAWQVMRLEEHISLLPHEEQDSAMAELKRLALEISTMVRLADLKRLAIAADDADQRETLEQFLLALGSRLHTLSDLLTDTYFRAAALPHQLISLVARRDT